MSDQTPAQNPEEKQMEAAAAPITIHAQYVRDVSFENPGAPQSLRMGQNAPEMDINIGMDARKIPESEIENLYEVVLNLRAVAERGEEPVFVAELQYGVAVSLDNVPEESHHPFLMIEMPRLVFPYARQILSDLTAQGGFPPLLLNPVDFQALYMERFGEEIEKTREQFREELQKDIEKTEGNA